MNGFGSAGNIGSQRAKSKAGMTGLLLVIVLVMLAISASAQDDSTSAVNTVGPISGAQTLWSIANESRPDRRANINQFMLAFVERNPDAFILGNINLMQEGVILEVPTVEEALRIPVAEAQRRVDEQMREFSELSRAELDALRQTARAPLPEPETTVEIDPEVVDVEPEVVEAPASEIREDPVPEPIQDSVLDVSEEIAPEAMPPVEELEVVDEAVAVEFAEPEPLVDPEIDEQLVIEAQAVDELDPEVEDLMTAAEDRPEGILPDSPELVETGPGLEPERLAEREPLVATEPVVQDEPFQPRPDTRLPEPEPVMDVGVSESVMDPGVGSSGISDDLGRVAILGTLLIGLLILFWVWKQRSRDGQAVPAEELPDTPLVGDDDWNQSGSTERRSAEAIDDSPRSDYEATVIRSVGEGASDDRESSEVDSVADAVKSEEEPLDIDALFKDEVDDGDDEPVATEALFDLADDQDEEEPKTAIMPGDDEIELTTDPDPDPDLDLDPDPDPEPDPELELDLELDPDPDPDPELDLDPDRELADAPANEQAEDLEELEALKELNLTGLDDDQEVPQPARSDADQAEAPAVGEADQAEDTLTPESEQPDAEEVSSDEFDFEWLKSGDEEDSDSSSDGLVDQAGSDETASLDERDANKGSDQPEAVVDEPVDEAAETDEGGEDWDDMMARDLKALVPEGSEADVSVDEDDTGGPEERGGPAESEPEAEAEQPPAAVDEQQQESAEEPVLSDKEAEVMIDLAEIYISSGDQQSAQELLKEIMRDGSGTMSARAQALQEKLD
jgi:pilus assembly protein FimV